MELTSRHVVTGGLIALAAIVLWAGVRAAPGGVKVPAAVTEDYPRPGFTPPPELPVLGPDQHVGGWVFSPHRYPPACGNDISVLIHHGYSTMALPHERDTDWIAAPPGEADL